MGINRFKEDTNAQKEAKKHKNEQKSQNVFSKNVYLNIANIVFEKNEANNPNSYLITIPANIFAG